MSYKFLSLNPAPHQASVRPYVEAQWLSSKLTVINNLDVTTPIK